jgi:hypothetical protein
VIFDGKGECNVLLASDAVGWWTKADAKAASAVWMREHAKPTENTKPRNAPQSE